MKDDFNLGVALMLRERRMMLGAQLPQQIMGCVGVVASATQRLGGNGSSEHFYRVVGLLSNPHLCATTHYTAHLL